MLSIKNWEGFVRHCAAFQSPAELGQFFEVILTFSEREELPKRLEIMRALLRGDKTQREIAQTLGVSIANITRASNLIKASALDLKVLLGVSDEH